MKRASEECGVAMASLSTEEIKKQQRELYKVYFSRLHVFFPYFILLIMLSVGIWLRMQPVSLSTVETTIDTQLEGDLYSKFLAEAHTNYPQLSSSEKLRYAQKSLEEAKKLQVYQEARSKRIADLKKNLRPEAGLIYPLDLDSYHHLFYTKNVLKYGSMFDKVVDGQRYDSFKYPPVGKARPNEHFFAHFAALFYRATHFFFNFTLLQSFVLIPIFLSAVLIILFFLFGKELMGLPGGFFMGFLAAVDPIMGNRGILGFTDTDMLNMVLTILVLFFVIRSFRFVFQPVGDRHRNFWKGMLNIVLASIAMALFAFTWTGWWYLFVIVIAAISIFSGYLFTKEKFGWFGEKSSTRSESKWKSCLLLLTAFIVLSSLLSIFFIGMVNFSFFLVQPFAPQQSIGDIVGPTGAPNIYRFFVAELQPQTLSTFIQNMTLADLALFFLGVLAFIFFIHQHQAQHASLPTAPPTPSPTPTPTSALYLRFSFLLLALFSTATAYMTFQAQRFGYYFGIALTIFSGFFFAYLFVVGAGKISIRLPIKKKFLNLILVLVFLLFVGFSPIPPFCSHGKCEKSLLAFQQKSVVYDNSVDNLMKNTQAKTSPDAIITSWWEDGNFFKSMAERRATIDPASQQGHHLPLVARVFTTGDEDEAISLLRMLDCGSQEPLVYLYYNETPDFYAIWSIVNDLVQFSRSDAEAYLSHLVEKKRISSATATYLLDKTKCEPPEAYLFVSDSLRRYVNAWSSYGFFDVAKTKIYSLKDHEQEAIDFIKQKLNATETEARNQFAAIQNLKNDEEVLNWLMNPLSLVEMTCGKTKEAASKEGKDTESMLRCVVGTPRGAIPFSVDLERMKIQYGQGSPAVFSSLVWADDAGFHEKTLNPALDPPSLPIIDSPVSLIITSRDKDGKALVLLAEQPLQQSMYVRLNYLNGAGLKHFSLFDKQQSYVKGNIYLWKILWPTNKDKGQGGLW